MKFGRHKKGYVDKKYYTKSIPLITPNPTFKTCGDPKIITSTTICKKCDVKTSSVGQECNTMKTHLELETDDGDRLDLVLGGNSVNQRKLEGRMLLEFCREKEFVSIT